MSETLHTILSTDGNPLTVPRLFDRLLVFEICALVVQEQCPDFGDMPRCDICEHALHDHHLFAIYGNQLGVSVETKTCPPFGRVKTGLGERTGFLSHNGNIKKLSFSCI